MSTLRESLRRVLARTLRRGASWLDRLAVRVTPAAPAAPDADGSPAGGPPAHWRQRVHRPPPAHWLARIRQQAPHLLDGEALAGTGWARISVSPPAVTPVGVTPTVDETAPRPLPEDRSPPAATGQPVASRPPRHALPLFAGRALHLRRAGSPPWTGRGASPVEAGPESLPRSSAPGGNPATALSESPTDLPVGVPHAGVQPTGHESAHRRAAPTAAVAQAAAGIVLPASPNPALAPPTASRSSRASPVEFSPPPAAGHLANPTPNSAPAPGERATPADAAGSMPARFTPAPQNWPSAAPPPNGSTAQPDTTPDLAAPGFKAATAHESPGWTRAAPWPDWRAGRPTGAPEQPDALAAVQPDHRAARPWPALPDWPDMAEPAPNPHEAVRQHLQRLEREQRGLLWNESPF